MAITTTYPTAQNVNVNTAAPGVNIAGAQLAGLNANWLGAIAAESAARKAKEEAYKRQLLERELAMKEAAAERAAEDQRFQQNFAVQQWRALQREGQERVPVYTTQLGGGPGTTVGMSQWSTKAGPGAMAAGYVSRKDAAQYAPPSAAGLAPAESNKANLYPEGSPAWYDVDRDRTDLSPSDANSGNVRQAPAAASRRADWFGSGSTDPEAQAKALEEARKRDIAKYTWEQPAT